MTRSLNLGIYMCSNECETIYCIENCGWPNEKTKCKVCQKDIGNDPGKGGHILARQNEGGRRVMSPLYKDAGGPFYVYNIAKVPFFFDAQRCYIEGEINRMKEKAVVKMGGKDYKLTGYVM